MAASRVSFAGSGIPRERHVQRRHLGHQSHFLAYSLDEQERCDLLDSRLDRFEADELSIELLEDFVDSNGLEFLAKIDLYLHRLWS